MNKERIREIMQQLLKIHGELGEALAEDLLPAVTVPKRFHCKCGNCEPIPMDPTLLEILEDLEDTFGRANINSAYRCPDHNKAVGGSKNSQHLYGKALDLWFDGTPPNHVAAYLERMYPKNYGIGRYNTFTHIDSRKGKARWDFRTP